MKRKDFSGQISCSNRSVTNDPMSRDWCDKRKDFCVYSEECRQVINEDKIIFWLTLDRSEGGHDCAVVIEDTGEEAKRRAFMMDRHLRDWRQASVSVQARVRSTRTPMVLAMDGVK